MTRPVDVAVVGGGVIGLALARELAVRGADVTVFERGRTGEEASWAAGGLLSAQSDAPAPSPFAEFARASRDLYPEWTESLTSETGLDTGWRRTGVLLCGDAESFERFRWQIEAGLRIERLAFDAISEKTAGRLRPGVTDGLFFPDDAVVHSRWLLRALARSVAMRGVRVREGVRVTRFVIERGTCRGVETTDGTFPAGAVVDAAGAWARLDPALPFAIPVEPIRGQIVELTDDAPFPTVLGSDDVYLVPHADGHVLAGATVERVGFRKEVTAAGVATILDAAIRLAPSLSEARVTDSWAGLRPGTPDALPLIGETPITGLYLASGHFRNGIQLAPITALRLADVLTAGVVAGDLATFSPERFATVRIG